MSRIPPPPREIDTAEEVAAYWRDVEREIDLADLDRPTAAELAEMEADGW